MFGRSLVLVFLLVVATIYVANELSRRYFSYSSDAFVLTDIVAVAPTVAGRLVKLSVNDNQKVATGDPLFEVDPQPYELALASAKASLELAEASKKAAEDAFAEATDNVASAKAVFEDAQKTEKRLKTLTDQGFVTQQRLDNISRDLATALADYQRAKAATTVAADAVKKSTAEIAAATAERGLAVYNLSQASVPAPTGGYIAPFTVREGAYLHIGDPVLVVVSDSQWRLVVNLPEERLAHLQVGQPTWMMIASKPWHIVRGRVKSVSRGIARSAVEPSALPYVAPITEWIRLSRRFPVEISFDDPQDLRLFMGADARVFIRHTDTGNEATAPVETGKS